MMSHVVALAEDPKLALPHMVFVKGNCFEMGDTFNEGQQNEMPPHEVCIDDFYMAESEVTQLLWAKIMNDNPSGFKDCSQCPVENISWHQTQIFIGKLNNITKKTFRLPSEAEWEYAARSGGKQERWSGINEQTALPHFSWYGANSARQTHPVMQKKPNALGLYDMTGNVWEWIQDWHNDDYYQKSPKTNPAGPSQGVSKGLRGGSWFFTPMGIRTTVRAASGPDHRFFDIGFRLAADVNEGKHSGEGFGL